jgi:hypothetical protein
MEINKGLSAFQSKTVFKGSDEPQRYEPPLVRAPPQTSEHTPSARELLFRHHNIEIEIFAFQFAIVIMLQTRALY